MKTKTSQAKSVQGASALDKENVASPAIAPSPSLGKSIASRISVGRPALGTVASNVEGSRSADVDMAKEAQMAAMVCSLENKEACLSCGS